MRIALFSQSLFALPLDAAIEGTAGLDVATELACEAPHFDLERARTDPRGVATAIRQVGLNVAALSLSNNFTDADTWRAQLKAAAT